MRKLLVAVAAVLVMGTGCKKSGDSCGPETTVAPVSEGDAVAAYLQTNGISATKLQTNLYYEVVIEGTGGNPTTCSNVDVSFIGKLTNGQIFQPLARTTFGLTGLIKGWMQGIPLMKPGGAIRLYIPPTLGYGPNDLKDNTGAVVVPGNSILIFDITLHGF